LILDHGDGYMTLYGHNLSLGRALGDRVEAGEVIAAVGTSGDAPRPGLYFEIRHDGEPQDPLHWCRTAFADRR
jgi:septal ring factor EnvC (AmiA/AmiB activator)